MPAPDAQSSPFITKGRLLPMRDLMLRDLLNNVKAFQAGGMKTCLPQTVYYRAKQFSGLCLKGRERPHCRLSSGAGIFDKGY